MKGTGKVLRGKEERKTGCEDKEGKGRYAKEDKEEEEERDMKRWIRTRYKKDGVEGRYEKKDEKEGMEM